MNDKISNAILEVSKKVSFEVQRRFMLRVIKIEGRTPTREEFFQHATVAKGTGGATEHRWKGAPLLTVQTEAKDGKFCVRFST